MKIQLKNIPAILTIALMSIGSASAMVTERTIQDQLQSNYSGFGHIDVEVQGSVAIVSGTLEGPRSIQDIEQIVANIDGVDRVINRVMQVGGR